MNSKGKQNTVWTKARDMQEMHEEKRTPRDDLHKVKNGSESSEKRIFGSGTLEWSGRFGKESGKKMERKRKEDRAERKGEGK